MKQLAVFTTPEMAKDVHLQHDSGFEADGVIGHVDDRPAHQLWITDETLPEGHHAVLTMTWPDGTVKVQHGGLFLKIGNRAVFSADIFEKPKGF